MIHPHLSNRRSILAFSDQAVDDQTFLKLFEAARWAASAFNEQPWRFIAGRRGEATFEKLLECLAEGNRLWAANAGLLFLSIAKKTSSHNQLFNRHAQHDLGLAVGNITFEAKEAGIDLHQMGGFDSAKAITLFHIPDDFEPVAIVAGGYPGDTSLLNENLKARAAKPRTRKPLNKLVFTGTFGQSHPLCIHPITTS